MAGPHTLTIVAPGVIRRAAARAGRPLPVVPTSVRVLGFAVATWLVPALLAAVEGHLRGPGWAFSRDLAPLVRFLWVGPLLIALEPLVDGGVRAEVTGWPAQSIIPDSRREAFDHTLARIERLARSFGLLVLTLVVAYGLSWLEIRAKRTLESHWIFGSGAPGALTWAGWWYGLVSAPLLYLAVLRWLWRYGAWTALLVRLAFLPPHALGVHPDRIGGLSSIARVHNLFAGLLLALSSLAAVGLANQLWHGQLELARARTTAVAFIVVSVVVFVAPLLVFSPVLLAVRRRAAGLYGEVAARHSQDFEGLSLAMVRTDAVTGDRIPDNILENQANLATSFDAVREMSLSLVTRKNLVVFVLAAGVPMALAALAQVPMRDLLANLKNLFL
jgi:hypothetical protein